MQHGFHNFKLTGEAVGADVVAAENFPATFLSVIQEHGYLPQQVFNLDKMGLFWKCMPSRTFLSLQEKRASGFKASKDRLTLLLGGNTSVDQETKPLIVYHSKNPCALKGYSRRICLLRGGQIKKDGLPVSPTFAMNCIVNWALL
jgi:hypothetical protein